MSRKLSLWACGAGLNSVLFAFTLQKGSQVKYWPLEKVQMACSIFAPGKWWKMRLFKFTFSRISAPNPQNQPLHINFIPFHLKSARPKLIRPQEPNSKSYIKFTTCWFEHVWTPRKNALFGTTLPPGLLRRQRNIRFWPVSGGPSHGIFHCETLPSQAQEEFLRNENPILNPNRFHTKLSYCAFLLHVLGS